MQSTFESLVIKTVHEKIESCLIPLLYHASSKAGTQVDLQDIFQRFTFDNISSIALGFDPNSLPNKFTNESQQIIDKFLHECISSRLLDEEKEKSMFNNNKNDESNFDMLNALVKENDEMKQVDHKFLRDTAINLLVAGRDTISATLSWFFWLVSTYPLVETKILKEIQENFITTKEENWVTSSGVEVIKNNLSKLVYLHGAICEALRLFPPMPFEHKCAVKSDILLIERCSC
ncbi:hypothetical protein PIB30_013875 [Stylosanthes scabra]|uniref:Cytochrome P450 n=1 Tax=Stylosanthes scabra TaxID=79078 RepID=A0ABU6U5M9_9FABA|nr:hypothetical protein [Stylosanthes scabra]